MVQILDCNDTQALIVHAVPGAAVFWRNLNASRLGDENTLHEGLPFAQGTKTGLNIWTHVVLGIFELSCLLSSQVPLVLWLMPTLSENTIIKGYKLS